MKLVQRFSTKHDDLIHDVAYDFYGKRMATCSSDQKIKVWDLDDQQQWRCTGEWKFHHGSIWRVGWAAPEYGQIIASCSFDRTVCIWEEPENSQPGDVKKWERKATLSDSHGSVTTVKFAPAHLGLKLAAASADGFVRVYEAVDITNLSQWQITDQFEVCDSSTGGVNCIDWNTSPLEHQSIAVGSNESVAKIYQYNDKLRKWEVSVVLSGHEGPIHDIAWAPSMGRSYHLLATASKDYTLRVWRLDYVKGKYEPKCIGVFKDHGTEVWRVEWNITGTVLASSGDDNTVRLWKQNFQGEWMCQSIISSTESER